MKDLIIVSNRLPISIKKSGAHIEVRPSDGGLATSMSGYTKRRGTKWIGWPGLPSDSLTKNDMERITTMLEAYQCYPVFLTQKQINLYYNGYSNSVLWPILHEFSVHRGDNDQNWKAYQAVNRLFTEATLQLSKPGGTIWVHDYQLLLVPRYLRVERPKDHIGFFLHTPFPDPDTFLSGKHASSLIAGMLGADLVGFHTTGYTEKFMETCRKLNIDTVGGDQVLLPTHTVHTGDFPISIDYYKFARASEQHKVRSELRRMERAYAGLRVIATVDRLDPAKGLVERLTAYKTLLESDKQFRGSVVMVMLVIPSREDIPEYQRLKQDVERLIEEINTTFGTSTWLPVEYMYRTMPFEELAALYQRADVAFIAPIRDGMNLVAKEYVASHQYRKGVLVLSETAGAADELKEAIHVNPAEQRSLVRGLHSALSLPGVDLRRRIGAMRHHIRRFSVQRWADTFMAELQQERNYKKTRTHSLVGERKKQLLTAYKHASRRLLLLDYDGVLRSFVVNPADAVPSKELKAMLRRLGRKNDVVMVSGRSRADLENWFGKLPIALAPEHGALFRRKGGHNWHKIVSSDTGWKHHVSVIIKHYADLAPGSLIEQKEWGVVWHYRDTTPYYGQKYLQILKRALRPIAKEYNLQLVVGDKVLEVRPAEVNKGRVAMEWLTDDYDFVFAIGDDKTDEDTFAAVPPGSYTVKVGRGSTFARFRLPDVISVLELLEQM